MLRIWLIRALLAAIPFLIYFTWRWRMKSLGREHGDTPWGWLVLAGGLLAAASLLVLPLVTPSHRGQTYVPAEAQPDGSVRPGRFE